VVAFLLFLILLHHLTAGPANTSLKISPHVTATLY
jgi:hypothetical protein